MKVRDSMRRDWDARARSNAFHYIASWRNDWDEASFFESGEDDFLRLVEPVLQKLDFDPQAKSMTELGCGAGRMTRSFARRFGSVTAVDVSSVMQTSAQNYLRDFANIEWVLTDGASLSGVRSGSMDFVFSYLVLQHFPSGDLVADAVCEMVRILRPGGVFLFQFNGSDRPTMNWRGRLISGLLDALHSIGFEGVSQALARLSGIDCGMVGGTWRGVSVRSAEIAAILRSFHVYPSGFSGEGTPLAWCYGKKNVAAQS